MRRWQSLAAGLLVAASATSADVHRCTDSRGGLVFQDAPCGTRGPGLTDATSPDTTPSLMRRRPAPVWIGPRRVRSGECMSVSPVLALLWPEADGTLVALPEVEGGLRLRLRADDGGVAFAVLLRARRSGESVPVAASPPDWPADAVGPPPPAPPSMDLRRLRLSTRLDAQALVIDGGPRLGVDNWRSPFELSFGERRSIDIRRAIQKGGALRLQVDIEGFGTVGSAALASGDLAEALSEVLKCSRG